MRPLTQKHEDQGSPHHDHRLQSIRIDHGREAPWGRKERAHQSAPTGAALWVPACVWPPWGDQRRRGALSTGRLQRLPLLALRVPLSPAGRWRRSQSQAHSFRPASSACGCPATALWSTIPGLFVCVCQQRQECSLLPTPVPCEFPIFQADFARSEPALSQGAQACVRCSGGDTGRRVRGFCLEQPAVALVHQTGGRRLRV